jgi:dolichol-phosphate mannosyltransferase
MKILIVTPARNEAKNLPLLFESIKCQIWLPHITWVIVDDGSSDETFKISQDMSATFDIFVLRREQKGNLISGAAYSAWWHGIDFGIDLEENFTNIMKLDADVSLDNKYFQELFFEEKSREADLIGGVISGLSREQSSYIPGPVKLYSRRAIDLLRQLPVATGFDVMDEVLCRQKGLAVEVVKSAKFSMNRKIGHSQGKLHGRFRNGLVCRWIGYAPEYFVFHLARYFFRSPFFLGSLWMLVGYLNASEGPYSLELRNAHKTMQRRRLSRLIRHPIRTFRELYF